MVPFLFLLFALFVGAPRALACEIHGTPVMWTGDSDASLSSGINFHYSTYDADNGDFTSWSVQAVGAGRFSERWGWQFAIPYVDRTLVNEGESGLGDASVLLFYRIWSSRSDSSSSKLDIYAGVKIPTGDSERLREESSAHSDSAMMAGALSRRLVGHSAHATHSATAMHDATPGPSMAAMPETFADSGAHSAGHHLTLGSGSWDPIIGAQGAIREGALGAFFDAQYNLRTKGDYDFKYGDETIVRLSAGYYAMENLWAGIEVSGEWREQNEISGIKQEGSKKSSAYAGPAVRIALRNLAFFKAAIDFPIAEQDNGLAGSADLRVRAGASIAF